MSGSVEAVSASPNHTMAKPHQASIHLLKGLGVEGDAHVGEKVKHRSRVRANPDQLNLRQVHLIHSELLQVLAVKGFALVAGQMGENITTHGIDLLALPTGARLRIGPEAIIEITGLRNPCSQLDGIKPGLMEAVLDRDEDGNLIRKSGVMAIVLTSGEVRPGDPIGIDLPPLPHQPLQPV